MHILKDLFYGNINPNEKRFDKKPEYAKFAKIVAESEYLLTEFINKSPNAQGELSAFMEYERFI